MRDLLAKHPALHPETILDEWNMALRDPPQNPQFQPCYILETVYQLKQGGLDYSCYYHIHDYQIDPDSFAKFMSPGGVALMARWWNRGTQWDGLFDDNGRVRPSYFAFKLLSRLTGDRLRLDAPEGNVHGFATYDGRLRIYNILVWNFADNAAKVDVTLEGIPSRSVLRQVMPNAVASSDDDNVRLRPTPSERLQGGTHDVHLDLEPYGISFFSIESGR